MCFVCSGVQLEEERDAFVGLLHKAKTMDRTLSSTRSHNVLFNPHSERFPDVVLSDHRAVMKFALVRGSNSAPMILVRKV